MLDEVDDLEHAASRDQLGAPGGSSGHGVPARHGARGAAVLARQQRRARAALGERAARRRLAQRRHPAGDLAQPRRSACRGRARDRAEQAARVGVLRAREQSSATGASSTIVRRT